MCVCVTSYTQTGCVRENDGCRDSRAMACKLQDQRSVISCTEFLASYPTHEGPNLPVPGSQFEPKLGSQNSWCRVYPWGDIQDPPRDHLEIHPWNPPLHLPRLSKHHAKHPCEPGHTPQTDTQSHRAPHRIESQHNQADPQTHRQDHNGYVSGAWTHLLTPLPRGGRESSQIQWWRRLRQCQH